MQAGAVTSYIDVAQLALYAFWLFFAGLIIYLRREDKREGYPLVSDRPGRIRIEGLPRMPRPKRFLLPHGGVVTAPRVEAPEAEPKARPTAPWPGSPLMPTGNPMIDGVGPAAYAQRNDKPELTFDDALPRIAPLRVSPGFHVEQRDPDPRGMTVLGADGVAAGIVREIWIDRSEPRIVFLEVEVQAPTGARRIMLPMNFSRVDGRRRVVKVASILASQFADVPAIKGPDSITAREEDRVTAYYAGGQLYAEPSRQEPLI
jgi:photosynthetic reaction center H subunit